MVNAVKNKMNISTTLSHWLAVRTDKTELPTLVFKHKTGNIGKQERHISILFLTNG